MLSPENARVLQFIAAAPDRCASAKALAQAFKEDMLEDRLELLHQKGFISIYDFQPDDSQGILFRSFGTPAVYQLTLEGHDALAEYNRLQEDARRQHAEDAHKYVEERLHREIDKVEADKNNRVELKHNFLVSAFQTILAWFLELFTEHHIGIINFIKNLFR